MTETQQTPRPKRASRSVTATGKGRRKATGGAGGIAFEPVLSALPHPVCVLREDNTFSYANPAAESFFGASAGVLARQPLDEIVAFGSPLLSLLDQVRRHRLSVNEYAVELALPRWDGAKLVDVYCRPMPDQPNLVHMMLLGRTMAHMIERQMTHRAAARSVSGLGAMLAHEIKNPLSGIRGAAQLIEPALDDGDRALAQLICSEADRIRDLVERMEVFSDEAPLNKEAVNIHDVLDHVRRIAENGFAKSIPISEIYDPSLPAIAGRRDKLVQVFLNLVKNAAEAVVEKGDGAKIVMRTRYRPGIRLSVPGAGARQQLPLVIEIEDNGSGIPEDLQPVLFDPFVTTKASGSGLGLALVAKTIGDHGGIIEFESDPGRTIFRALMPMHETT